MNPLTFILTPGRELAHSGGALLRVPGAEHPAPALHPGVALLARHAR